MRFYIRTYFGTQNLGDAIQTYALCRLLPGTVEAWPGDDAADGRPFVVNGWLGRAPVWRTADTAFAGVYVSPRTPAFCHWAGTTARPPVGARDPRTLGLLAAAGVPAVLAGCATITLPRYAGPRSGTLYVDDLPRYGHCSPGGRRQYVRPHTPWPDQWTAAKARLDELRRAALVVTRRLHVALPCLAMGTPVRWDPGGDQAAERFSILGAMGLVAGDVAESFDAGPWVERYRSHLAAVLDVRLVEREPGTL